MMPLQNLLLEYSYRMTQEGSSLLVHWIEDPGALTVMCKFISDIELGPQSADQKKKAHDLETENCRFILYLNLHSGLGQESASEQTSGGGGVGWGRTASSLGQLGQLHLFVFCGFSVSLAISLFPLPVLTEARC